MNLTVFQMNTIATLKEGRETGREGWEGTTNLNNL